MIIQSYGINRVQIGPLHAKNMPDLVLSVYLFSTIFFYIFVNVQDNVICQLSEH